MINTAALTTVFVAFMARMGFDKAFALAEIEVLMGKTKDEYMIARRTGLQAIGNRAKRAEVYMAYENAQNHASFEPAAKANNCPRCAGSGNISAYQHHKGGTCFQCGGSGLFAYLAA